jgi:hypothetical protein
MVSLAIAISKTKMRIWSRFLNRWIEGNVVDVIWHWKVDGDQIEIWLLVNR